ncbi:MAG: sigma-70 family RNA polymerase sigma factor [Bdellovibrionota bacterium]
MSSQRQAVVERFEEEELDAEETPTSVERDPAREEEVNRLILNHRENGRKLARSILRRWRVRMPAEEIDSIVDLSLCEAARRYSSERGASFMTFFFYHLRGHLVRAVARAAQGNNVFLSFAKNAGVDASDWSHLSNEVIWSYVPEYLVFGQRDIETPEHAMIRREKIRQCQSACSQLDNLEKEIIDRSFSSEQPLVDIAKTLGYSRCHISRVKKTALDRLKTLLDGVTEEAVTEKKEELAPVTNVSTLRATSAERKGVARRSRRRSAGRTRIKRLSETKAA